MRTILLLGHKLTVDSPAVKHTVRIAKALGAHVHYVLVAPPVSTTEWIEARSARAVQRLRRLRARQPTADWVETLEQLRKKEAGEADENRRQIEELFEQEGITMSCHQVPFDSTALMRQLEELTPVELMVAGRLRLPAELKHQGVMGAGDLGARLKCTALDAEIMEHRLRPTPREVWLQLAAYGAGAAGVYLLFFPRIEGLNQFFMSGGVLPGLAIMATAAAVAWVYGKAVECLLKLTRIDIY